MFIDEESGKYAKDEIVDVYIDWTDGIRQERRDCPVYWALKKADMPVVAVYSNYIGFKLPQERYEYVRLPPALARDIAGYDEGYLVFPIILRVNRRTWNIERRDAIGDFINDVTLMET
jgi:hypothetical protein